MKLNVDRIMSRYIFIVLILMLSGCSPVNRQKIRVESGLDYGEFRKCILFPCPSIGLMGGCVSKKINLKTRQSEGVGYGIFDAMCWRSIDGGRNWTSQKLTDGALQELVVKDNIVYAVVNPKSNEWGYETFIYESRNFGADWTFKCGIKGSMVRLHVRDSNWMIGYIGYKLCETQDGGKNWHILKTSYRVLDEFYHGRYVYYLSYFKEPLRRDLLVRYDLYTGEEKMQRLPAGSNVAVGKENIIFVTKGKTDELDIYRINDDFSLSRLSTIKDGIPVFVRHVEIHADEIYMHVTFERESLFVADESFYYSPDRGKSWKKLGTMGHSRWYSDEVTRYVDDDGFKIVYNDDIYSINIFWN